MASRLASGPGLAVVYAIARAHGGTARCLRSRLGGTCMQIMLPASGK
ncbi:MULTISPECIES: hypothetical protein [Erwinia]